MSGERRCGTCRHFESSLDPRQGWCRNPRLIAPGRSQPVAAIDLACAYRGGDYWEPMDSAEDALLVDPGQHEVYAEYPERDLTGGPDSPRIPPEPAGPQPSLYNDKAQDAGARITGQPGEDAPTIRRRQRPDSRSIGQEPFVSYQPEERYWTDYLRIALPIAGLLLLLGVFWYWASSFIGDDDQDPGRSTEIAVVETPITAPTQTPTVSAAVTLAPAQTVAPTPADVQTQPTPDASQPTATTGTVENGGGTDGYQEGEFVVVNDDNVNLRADATTSADVVVVLSNGEELSILSGTPVEDETYTWWNVATTNGDEGWVVGQFIERSGS
ncbi:MAG: SH3 domain-containing protein [Thermomicrobiales bacterium]